MDLRGPEEQRQCRHIGRFGFGVLGFGFEGMQGYVVKCWGLFRVCTAGVATGEC